MDRPTIAELIDLRLSRRALLGGTAAVAATAALPALAQAPAGSSLGFTEIPHAMTDSHVVSPGHRVTVMMRWGDPVHSDAPAFDPANQTAQAQAGQFGHGNDFLAFFPLPLGSGSSDRGLLSVNHEHTIPWLMFPGMADNREVLAKITREQVDIEIAAHGLSIVEIERQDGAWRVVRGSPYARRITMTTPMRLTGPAAGHARMQTPSDPTGTRVLGTLNNCAGGYTPWGTVLTAEENFNAYFGGDPAQTPEAENHRRYGLSATARKAWSRHHARFDVGREPNEPNRFGWIVEIDPYDPTGTPVKRTALGRCKHECATTVVAPDGRLVVYSGDDERFQHVYRFVTEGRYDPQNRAANRDLLDRGILYVARFEADGSLDWLPLVQGQGKLTEANGFRSQADVLIDLRRAGETVGATRMDRPEDVETNPVTGRVYVVLTNNNLRKPEQVDAANPRADNRFGHILELVPPGGTGASADHAAPRFAWNVFLRAGDPGDAAQGAQYGGPITSAGWLACPDNVAFDTKGRMWIGTDGFDNYGVHDGVWVTDTVGPGRARPRHFFGCPTGAEMTGPCFTPDGRTLFLSVQHPGEDDGSSYDKPSTRWPDFRPDMPPRPAVIAITREDGGELT